MFGWPARKKTSQPRSKYSSRSRWRRHGKRIFFASLLILGLMTLPISLWLSKQSQENRGAAAYCSGAFNCSVRCNDGHVTTDICPAYGAFGSCTQWGDEACNMRGGVKDRLSDGGVGGTFDDGSGGATGGSGGYTCPNNQITAVHCRGQQAGHRVGGVCTCRKTAKGCGCFVESGGGGSGSGGSSSNTTRVNASRCDNKDNPHQYCISTFGEGNYCGRSGNNGNQYQCMPRRATNGTCNIAANKNAAPYNGDTNAVCAIGFKCLDGACAPDRAVARCPNGGNDGECPIGSFCNNNKICVPKREAGLNCGSPVQCTTNLCVSGKCAVGNLADGFSASSVEQCRSRSMARDGLCGCYRQGHISHQVCGSDAYCLGSLNSSQCMMRKSKDQPCGYDYQCLSNDCSATTMNDGTILSGSCR